MATETAQIPKNVPLCRTRGDTAPWTFVIKDTATPPVVIDITGRTYLLTLDTLEEPTDTATNVFELTGTVAVGTDGKVTFEMSLAQADALAIIEYFYDVQQTDGAGKLKTIIKSTFTVAQDITKT